MWESPVIQKRGTIDTGDCHAAAKRPCLSLWERWTRVSGDGEGVLSTMGIATPV